MHVYVLCSVCVCVQRWRAVACVLLASMAGVLPPWLWRMVAVDMCAVVVAGWLVVFGGVSLVVMLCSCCVLLFAFDVVAMVAMLCCRARCVCIV